MIFALFHTKVQVSTQFSRGVPWIFAHAFNVPLPSLLWFIFFSLEMWDRLRPKYPEKYKNPNIWRGKKKKKSKKARRGHTKHTRVCAKFQGLISQKRREHWTLTEFGVLGYLEAACMYYLLLYVPPGLRRFQKKWANVGTSSHRCCTSQHLITSG